MFRCADAFGVQHIHLTGYTPKPPRAEISKTALGAEEWIPWSSGSDPFDVIAKRRKEGFAVVALEHTAQSRPLSSYSIQSPVCLIVGHEVLGVSDDLLSASDAVVHIPMAGRKESLNVSVALGIALFHLSGLDSP